MPLNHTTNASAVPMRLRYAKPTRLRSDSDGGAPSTTTMSGNRIAPGADRGEQADRVEVRSRMDRDQADTDRGNGADDEIPLARHVACERSGQRRNEQRITLIALGDVSE